MLLPGSSPSHFHKTFEDPDCLMKNLFNAKKMKKLIAINNDVNIKEN